MRCLILLTFLLTLAPVRADDWGPLAFLVGKWTGAGGGGPGQGSGAFSFTPDLQNAVLVRKSFAAYPPANGKPAFRHDDLMIVYRDEASHGFRAIYFDSEAHTIQYSVKPYLEKPGDGGVVFESAPGRQDEVPQSAPRYRMTYTNTSTSTEAATARFKFEIAPPGKDFTAYIEASLRREKP
ncbi:MAG TPA: hypothetical protein VNY05_14430 [Candidatus Acidoferrales bacterium]|nr:hypothetical protein [Candidatus Acidoferrales bacterium]